MKAGLRNIGAGATPLVVVDGFTEQVEAAIELAAALAPFPPAVGSFYPGLRRVITPADREADGFAHRCMESAAPFIAGAFKVDDFDLREVSFSIVNAAPESLAPAQRAPHFDSTNPNDIALLLYLSLPWPTGTAFYRHRATGIEQVHERNVEAFVCRARAEVIGSDLASGYLAGSNKFYDQIEIIDAIPDRLLIYPGSLLHSGVVPAGAALAADPRVGRLTMNFFITLTRNGSAQ